MSKMQFLADYKAIKSVYESTPGRPKTSLILSMFKRYDLIYQTYFAQKK